MTQLEEKLAMQFSRTFSGAPWESKVGYCRAIRPGHKIYVTGTTSIAEDGTVFAPQDGYRQAKLCFEMIEQALHATRGRFKLCGTNTDVCNRY